MEAEGADDRGQCADAIFHRASASSARPGRRQDRSLILTNTFWTVVTGATVVAGFGFMGTAPFIACYVVLVGGLVGLATSIGSQGAAAANPASIAIYAGLGLLAITLPFVYRSPTDFVTVAACLPLLAAPGVAALMNRRGIWLTPHAVPLLCLFGTAAALALGAWEFYSEGVRRAGAGNNPIHYGGIATILGYLALVGTVSSQARWRLVYLLGPAMAIVAVVLSGSRGPLLAWVALVVVTLPILVAGLKHRALAIAAIAMAAIGICLFVYVARDSLVVQRVVQVVERVQGALATGDFGAMFGTDDVRAAMYDTGWRAFLSSPLVGIGFGQLMPLSRELHPLMENYLSLEHLHSDFADFAGAAGLPGVVAWVLFLAAPFLALGGAGGYRRPERLLGATVLTIGYLTLGLTNAMFGVLPQTTLYGIGLGYLIALGARKEIIAPRPSKSDR